MKQIYTTLGPKRREELGMILPHEHVFVDLRTPDRPGYAKADVDDVVALMVPQIEAIKRQGISLLVECTTGGVGRRADIDLAVSKAADFPIVVPTGNYREPWIPRWVAEASEVDLEQWMVAELTEGIEDTGVLAGWIKLSAGDDGITPLEARILRAAAAEHPCEPMRSSAHIRSGKGRDGAAGHPSVRGLRSRAVQSIHTQEEKDFQLHKALVERGAWIEYDHVGRARDEEVVAADHARP